ncbi:hypothetical protein ACFVRU_35185, partial [Streptomyces sp. NPDC057927]
MGYAESLGSYWRGRYKLAPGKYATVRDAGGDAIRFRTKAAAKKAADAEEAKLLAGTKKAPRERITFGAYVNRWYAAQDLAASTMQNYRRHIEEHLLPAFEDSAVADILSTDIAAWEKSAIRAARGFTGRDKILKFEGSYHGHGDSLLIKAGSGVAT